MRFSVFADYDHVLTVKKCQNVRIGQWYVRYYKNNIWSRFCKLMQNCGAVKLESQRIEVDV